MSPRVRAAIALAGVFALGAAAGAGGAYFVAVRRVTQLLDAPPSVGRQRVALNTLDRELGLSAEQRETIRRILATHDPDFTDVQRSVEPKLTPIFAAIEGEIRLALTPDQRLRFDELVRKFHDRRRESAPPPI